MRDKIFSIFLRLALGFIVLFYMLGLTYAFNFSLTDTLTLISGLKVVVMSFIVGIVLIDVFKVTK